MFNKYYKYNTIINSVQLNFVSIIVIQSYFEQVTQHTVEFIEALTDVIQNMIGSLTLLSWTHAIERSWW